jgi:chitinase
VFRVVSASAKPSLSIGDASATEGNSGTTTLSFAVTLSAASSRAVSVSYATLDGTAKAPEGTLTFQAGEKSKAISVSIAGDAAIEQDETFAVEPSSPVNASVAKTSATGTIKKTCS